MKKKLLSMVVVLAMLCTFFAGCKKSTYELALITDVGTIDDKSFNQGAWEGLEQYAKENKIAHKYYKPAEKSKADYISTIELAIKNGAKLVVCPGYLFEDAVYECQTKYPEVKFILLDGQPHDTEYTDYTITDNVLAIFYAEEQAGFLAGYAAVQEGYTDLGFMGGMAVPAVIRYGYGFAQGADYAAKELGIANVNVKYHYTGGFVASPEIKSMSASWYTDGTQVIFGCGGAVGNSVMAAASDDASGAKVVIGVDVDQSGESDTVITSAMKGLGASVYDGIKAYYNNAFEGGKVITRDASVDGVSLPMSTSKFVKFTQDQYDAIFAKLVSGEITLSKDAVTDEAGQQTPIEITTLDESLANVTITFVE